MVFFVVLSRFIDTTVSFLIAAVLTILLVTLFLTKYEQVDGEEGSNYFKVLYYKKIKHYLLIVNDRGERYLLSGRKKGGITCIRD